MENIYFLMIIALAVLAVIDLVVGVSNDAVNFLNSAIGSKAIPVKKILIIASLGVLVGALTSSGMMEVARKGIFNPEMFAFQDIIYIFMAVMITDILLLDVFNTLGMPTSTTVSIVFELLGAAVAMSLIKIAANNQETVSNIWKYINHKTALMIIFGILLSVFVAFTVGALVQFISRLIYSFQISKRPTIVNTLFGGVALTAITYFIFIKGLKGSSVYSDVKNILADNLILIIGGGFLFFLIFSYLATKVFKWNILVIIIAIGTFSLAMAFSGNDLVNFIGVPIAGWNSYEAWHTAYLSTGVTATDFSMEVLAKKVPSNDALLLIAGIIMVLTIWFSSKAKEVIKTGVDLSRQDEGNEKFKPNNTARFVVRIAIGLNKVFSAIMPKSTLQKIDKQFQRPVVVLSKDKSYEMPAFDMVRASVNLVVAGILITIGTSFHLPLSTTYVTFMVAMGTSLADRAWGRESAVYRVAGVLNVVGGWFLTAIVAFTASATALYLIHIGGPFMIAVLLALVLFLIVRNYMRHNDKVKKEQAARQIKKAELKTIGAVINQSSDHINEVLTRVIKLYNAVIKELTTNDLNKLSKSKKHVDKLNAEIETLKDDVFDFIKSLDETSVEASRFYILVLASLQDIAQSMGYIVQSSHNHVNNNHRPLKKGQTKDLLEIRNKLGDFIDDIKAVFASNNFEDLSLITQDKIAVLDHVSESIERQIKRIRTEETSKKNTSLYFGILLETQDFIGAIEKILSLYQNYYRNVNKNNVKL
jgi:phosphate/sulfate permease